MYISDFCANCLYEKQAAKVSDARYLAAIKELLDHRTETDTSPYMTYRFDALYESWFHKKDDYTAIKKDFNELALSMEPAARQTIQSAADPLKQALLLARIGNYIDFGAMTHVDPNTFLTLFEAPKMSEKDEETYAAFLKECSHAKTFLLLTDNCGEVVFDKLMLFELKKRFPHLQITAMVRGCAILNDATLEDAYFVGLDQAASLISNGNGVAGTIYSMLSPEAKAVFDQADVKLAKGQGNYESLSHQGNSVFYSFLCKCDMFAERFQVPKLTGMFLQEA